MDKINESKFKIKEKEDYSFNKNKDYNNIIQKQKDWLDTLHQNHDNINNFNNLGNYNNKFNNYNSYNYLNNKNNINKSQSLNKSDSIPIYYIKAYSDNNYKINLNYNNNNIKEEYDKNNRINNITYPVGSNIKKERVYYHTPYKNAIKKQMINNNFNKFIYKPELHISNNKNQNELIINQIRQNQINDNINKDSNIKNDQNKKDNYILNAINERYLIINNEGTPIYQKGKRILGMKLIKNKENKKDNLNKNESIIFLGPDGQFRSIKELKPIILDNNIPLVNEDNKPFLGVNNIFLIDENGNPITGQTEMINENKQVVQGELGILPRDKYGNILKIKFLNDNDNGNRKNNNNNSNNIGIDIDNNNIIKNKKIKKKINNSVDIKNNNKKRYFPELIKTKINLNNITQFNNNKNKNKKINKNKVIENNKNSKVEFLYSSCFACDVGCGVSRTGYSSMTYSPFNKRLKRKEETSLKNGTKYEQYYKYKN